MDVMSVLCDWCDPQASHVLVTLVSSMDSSQEKQRKKHP